jgi:hypothetical protein
VVAEEELGVFFMVGREVDEPILEAEEEEEVAWRVLG